MWVVYALWFVVVLCLFATPAPVLDPGALRHRRLAAGQLRAEPDEIRAACRELLA
jgi:hypothetical protein